MENYSGSRLRVGAVFSKAIALIKRNPIVCAVGVLIMFVLKTEFDIGVRQLLLAGSWQAGLAGLPILLVLSMVHYFIIFRLMQVEEESNRGWSGFGLLSFLAADVLATLGLIFGMILLIVPGVFLAIRWTIFANFVIGRGLGPIKAIKASWEATRGSAGTIFAVLLIIGLATLVGIVLMLGLKSQAAMPTSALIAYDIWTEALSMLGLCVTTSIYFLLTGPDHTRLKEVFA